MINLLYALIFFTLLFSTVAYFTRYTWLPPFLDAFDAIEPYLRRAPGGEYLYQRLPFTSNSFEEDMEAGLSSADFDLAGNVGSSDGRAGLDDEAKREILKIMKRRRLQFDDARKLYMERRFKAMGISADGLPKDPKFVSFS
ncbi:hypothetical protein B0T20DRAFT_162581 [Sordaria brevicollis]|uniref:Uncharacterized protein n=1 Tax=Sordaria brevicollis TaxID=83679 RepID=A0AAE0UF68_SORBR|nr:hypothetical protein B0T20DRAFT_162581 [Sordaria brevicollis]